MKKKILRMWATFEMGKNKKHRRFGAKAPTATYLRNESDGKETSMDKTIMLFYVACSRTKENLAIVAHTNEPAKVKSHVIEHGWFGKAEVTKL